MDFGRFFESIPDPALFDFGEVNLFRYFHVKYIFRVAQSGKPGWRANPAPSNLAGLLKKFPPFFAAAWKALRLGRGKILFYNVHGRHALHGDEAYDLYNSRVLQANGRANYVLIEEERDRPKQFSPDLHWADFYPLIAFFYSWAALLFGRRLRRFARRVARECPGLGFSESYLVHTAAKFLGQSLAFGALLDVLKPRAALMVCGYGKEAFIHACRRRGIPTTELMHGLITPTNPNYNFPPAYAHLFQRALFPQRIAVFGQYWKDNLVQGGMFPAEAVAIGGYYLHTEAQERQPRHAKKVLLITGQPTVQQEMCAYIRFLKEHMARAEWEIWIKPHPAETTEPYLPLVEEGFVRLETSNTYALLAQADIHVSAYSTVLYEALLYGVCNYAVGFESSLLHTRAIWEAGVARPLLPHEVPQLYPPSEIDVEHFFAPFDPAAFRG